MTKVEDTFKGSSWYSVPASWSFGAFLWFAAFSFVINFLTTYLPAIFCLPVGEKATFGNYFYSLFLWIGTSAIIGFYNAVWLTAYYCIWFFVSLFKSNKSMSSFSKFGLVGASCAIAILTFLSIGGWVFENAHMFNSFKVGASSNFYVSDAYQAYWLIYFLLYPFIAVFGTVVGGALSWISSDSSN
jgi:hypothetical protein